MRKEQDKFDLLGREIQVGDIIAYPVTVNRSAAMRIGRVVSIDVALQDEWQGVKTIRMPDPDNGYTMKVQYLEESMDWGMYSAPERDAAYHRESLQQLAGGYLAPHWLQGEYEDVVQRNALGISHVVRRPKVLSKDAAFAAARKYHETRLRAAEKILRDGPKPKTLLFPGKAVVISCAFPVRKTES